MLSSWQRPLALVLTACSTGAGEMGAAASTLVAHPRTQSSSRAGAVAELAAGGPDGAANPLGPSSGWSPFLLQQCLLAMLSAWVPRNSVGCCVSHSVWLGCRHATTAPSRTGPRHRKQVQGQEAASDWATVETSGSLIHPCVLSLFAKVSEERR